MNIKTKYNIGDIVWTKLEYSKIPAQFHINAIGIDVMTSEFDNELHTIIIYYNEGAEFVYEQNCFRTKEELENNE